MTVKFIEPSDERTQTFLTAVADLPKGLPYSGKGGPLMIGKTTILFIWAALSYYFALKSYALWENWWITGLAFAHFGIALAFLTINVGHDAGHDAYSEKPWVNWVCGFMMSLTGGNIFSWRTQHGLHHKHTNIENADPDISYGGLLRILSSEKWRPIHKYQYIYVWFLYLGAGLQIIWVSDFLLFCTGKIRTVAVEIPTREYFIYIAWKIIHVLLFYVIPSLVLQEWLYTVIMYFCMVTAAGYLMAILFQMAHVVDMTQFVLVVDPGKKNDLTHIEQLAHEANANEVVVIVASSESEVEIKNAWIIHEILTTADISPENKVMAWFFGGLTMQIEHHLFPHICHLYYGRIQKNLARLCQAYEIPYYVCSSFVDGIRRHARKLKMMGRKPQLLTA
ncbi:MAG: acyl-CoA desaturase [Candidatus Pacebacteria bacterium]|nr:acyl-CoA desaturase [Candidatus Paceibacterota bacterium]